MIDEVPSGVDPDAWLSARPAATVQVGQLWSMSWNAQHLGLGVLAGVAPTFVLVWPVSLPDEARFPPAVAVPAATLRADVAVWPTRETGVGLHLLHRCFGSLMSARTMEVISEAAEDSVEGPFPFVDAWPTVIDIEAASDDMVDRWESICLHTWPQALAGVSPLDTEVLKEHGLSLEVVAQVLDASVPQVFELFRGERYPTIDELQRLASARGLSPDVLLGIPESVYELARPEYKEEILELAARLQIDESHSRELVRSELALAARSEGSSSGLIRAAVARLRERSSE